MTKTERDAAIEAHVNQILNGTINRESTMHTFLDNFFPLVVIIIGVFIGAVAVASIY